jgi:membrane-bound metal-dependent hydrolase YbcI (DUF457 family)
MHKNGHAGVSALLTAPCIAILFSFELYILGIIFSIFAMILSSFPDIDMNISSLKHRGFTHTIQFAFIVGVFVSIFVFGVLIALNTELNPVYIKLLNNISYPIWVIPIVAGLGGFAGIFFHMLGDIPTPQGIHFFSRQNNYGFSLNLFNANNKSANKYINTVGFLALGGGIIVGMNPTQDLLIAFAGFIAFTLISWIIISTTRIGDLLY